MAIESWAVMIRPLLYDNQVLIATPYTPQGVIPTHGPHKAILEANGYDLQYKGDPGSDGLFGPYYTTSFTPSSGGPSAGSMPCTGIPF